MYCKDKNNKKRKQKEIETNIRKRLKKQTNKNQIRITVLSVPINQTTRLLVTY